MKPFFTKQELQAQIESLDIRISELESLHPLTLDQEKANQIELHKLSATRSRLLERLETWPQ